MKRVENYVFKKSSYRGCEGYRDHCLLVVRDQSKFNAPSRAELSEYCCGTLV